LTRVVVCGAGYAGLAAATELADRGVKVIVLEERDRVGGRVWSDRAPGGAVIERGAEFILEGYEVMRALAARFGLEVADTGMSYYVREPRGVEVDTAELQAAGQAAARATSPGSSVADVVASLGLPAAVAEAVLARVEISAALGADRLAAGVREHAAAVTPLPTPRRAGGNPRLAEAMAARLGERVRLGTPVRGLDGARVLTDGGALDADRVVLALPLPALRSLPLPDWKRAALDRAEMGHAAKLHLALARPAPTSAVMSVPGRFWCWTAAGAEGVLNCFAGSPAALERLAVADGPAAWAERARRLRPDLALDPADAILTTWPGGAYSTPGLRSQPGDEALLAAPAGPLHFAGEHTSGPWAGLMEGALRSGLRAAREVP
jgi:monoamine oxidase